jgi:hypothetical protein
MVLQNLFGNIQGALGGLSLGRRQNQGAQEIIGRFCKVLSHGDWWDTTLETGTGLIACTAGVWQMIARYKVQPRQRAHYGFGSALAPDNQGYMYLALYDDTATNSVLENGKVRLIQLSADMLRKVVIAEFRTEELRGSATDRMQMKPLPEQDQYPWVAEDSYLALEFLADATDMLAKAAIGTALGLDIWNVPVTVETKA